MKNSKISIINAFFWSSSSRIIGGVLRFISTPILLAYYGDEQYGLIGLSLSINVYMQIMEMGFNTGNVRYLSQWIAQDNNQKIVQLIQTNLLFYALIGVINAAALIFISFYSQELFNISREQEIIFSQMLYVLAISSFISWTWSISSQVLRAYEHISYDEILNLLTKILVFIAAIFASRFKLSLITYFILYGIAIVTVLPIKTFRCVSLNSHIKFKFKWNTSVFKEVFKYSSGIFVMSIFQISARSLRPIIIGIQAELSDVTEYYILEQITNLILLISGSFMAILLPYVTKMKTLKNNSAQRFIAYNGTKYLSVILVMLVFILILTSKQILNIYVGEKYEYLSIWLIIWSIATLGYHNAALSAIVLADTNIKPLTYYSIFSATLSLILAWLLTPTYKVGGAVISMVIYTVSQMLFYYVYYIPRIMKLSPLRLLFGSFLLPVLNGLISLLVTLKFIDNIIFTSEIYQIAISSLLFIAIYSTLTLIYVVKIKEVKGILF